MFRIKVWTKDTASHFSSFPNKPDFGNLQSSHTDLQGFNSNADCFASEPCINSYGCSCCASKFPVFCASTTRINVSCLGQGTISAVPGMVAEVSCTRVLSTWNDCAETSVPGQKDVFSSLSGVYKSRSLSDITSLETRSGAV